VTIRTKEPEVPIEFPPARLYLNDIEEIVRILSEFVESRKNGRSHATEAPQTTVRYSTSGEPCEECDNVEELPKIVKWYREFRISVSNEPYSDTVLIFHPLLTRWTSSGLTKADTWSAYHKLESVFNKRRRRWSALLHAIPWGLNLLLWAAPGALFVLAFNLDSLSHLTHAATLGLLTYAAIIAALVNGARHTILVPRHSWDPSPIHQYLTDKIVPLIVGAILGILGTLLAQYLSHKLWP